MIDNLPKRRIFVSYSHKDEAHKDRLLTHLKLMERQGLIEPWVDRQIVPTEEWDPAIGSELDNADLILLLVSADFLASDYCWSVELKRSMERHDAGQARVLPIFVKHCEWKGAPFGKLQGTPKDAKPVTAYPDPDKAWTEVTRAVRSAVDQISVLSPPTSPSASRVRWTDELRIYGEVGLFAGRKAELKLLDDALAKGRVRVLSLWAEGGAGKTRLLVQWLNQVRDEGWRGLKSVFVHSFYSQGSSEERSASSDNFFDEALTHFGYAGDTIKDPSEKGRQLAELVAAADGLLVLDGLEPLQYPPHDARKGELKDTAIRALLLSLANASAGLCLVTTRQELPELQARLGNAVAQQSLDRLSDEDGMQLLCDLGIQGPDQELREAVVDFHGHAYSLMLLGTYLREATEDHEIRRRHDFPLVDTKEEHDNHVEHIFATYERHLGGDNPEVAVLRLLGFFDRPAAQELIDVLRAPGEDRLFDITQPLQDLRDPDWRRILTRLTNLRLLSIAEDSSLDSHPLLREHFARQLRNSKMFSEAFTAGHRRLYVHLTENTEHQPDTLAGLQPLYQAVRHGCLAGMQQKACEDVYIERIQRGTGPGGNYSIFKLGATSTNLGAVTCFFEDPWRRLSSNLSEADQAWLLNEAGFYLRALGRLTDALEPMGAGVEMYVALESWKSAALTANNHSALELRMGLVADAIVNIKRAIEIAERSGDEFARITSRTVYAGTLHQAGRLKEALAFYRQAEAIQIEEQADFPLLYSYQGIGYCELLLAEAERAAWQAMMDLNQQSSKSKAACDDVVNRATQTLEWAKQYNLSLLSIALGNLTLARVALYSAILFGSPVDDCISQTCESVTGLRKSGSMDDLPSGLLTRAWVRFVSDDEAGCRSDLDEAWEIAERGPMKLHMTDIHLYRARLFRDTNALDAAAALIEETGYHRRDEELADAREAAKNWPKGDNK